MKYIFLFSCECINNHSAKIDSHPESSSISGPGPESKERFKICKINYKMSESVILLQTNIFLLTSTEKQLVKTFQKQCNTNLDIFSSFFVALAIKY